MKGVDMIDPIIHRSSTDTRAMSYTVRVDHQIDDIRRSHIRVQYSCIHTFIHEYSIVCMSACVLLHVCCCMHWLIPTDIILRYNTVLMFLLHARYFPMNSILVRHRTSVHATILFHFCNGDEEMCDPFHHHYGWTGQMHGGQGWVPTCVGETAYDRFLRIVCDRL